MGIRGLTSFVAANGNVLFDRDSKLHEHKVVVDGMSLMYSLLALGQGGDLRLSGDYSQLALAWRCRMQQLRRCKCEPVIVFDGTLDLLHAKKRTTMYRLQQGWTTVAQASTSRKTSDDVFILPPLAAETVRNECSRLNVTFYQAPGDADRFIATTARFLEAVVISADSDFYLWDIPGGYIPIDHIDWQPRKFSCFGESYYLKCDIFRVEKLLSAVPELTVNLLSLFSILSGNDFSDETMYSYIYNDPRFCNTSCSSLQCPRKTGKNFIKLLHGLSTFESLGDAVRYVTNAALVKIRPAIEKVLSNSLTMLDLPSVDTSLSEMFRSRMPSELLDIKLDLPDDLWTVVYDSTMMLKPVYEHVRLSRNNVRLYRDASYQTCTTVLNVAPCSNSPNIYNLEECQVWLALEVVPQLGELMDQIAIKTWLGSVPDGGLSLWMLAALHCHFSNKQVTLSEASVNALLYSAWLQLNTGDNDTRQLPFEKVPKSQNIRWNIVHTHNQFQLCFQALNQLNSALGCPFPPSDTRLFNGPLLHYFVSQLRTSDELLVKIDAEKGTKMQFDAFRNWFDVVFEMLDGLKKMKKEKKKEKKKKLEGKKVEKKKRGGVKVDMPTFALDNRFALLHCDE